MNEERAYELAAQALQAAVREQWETATDAVQAIGDECGPEGVEYACRAWCDALIVRYQAATGLPYPAGEPVRPVWQDAVTGTLKDADEVGTRSRWAGRLLAARAALDYDAYKALIASVPPDPQVVGEHVGTLLTTVATTLRDLMAGAS